VLPASIAGSPHSRGDTLTATVPAGRDKARRRGHQRDQREARMAWDFSTEPEFQDMPRLGQAVL
jgi:hypothetical protein